MMGSALRDVRSVATVPPGMLPARMRVLYVTTHQRRGSWLAEAFASDSATQVELEEATGVSAGLARLRDEVFDAVLACHEPGELDALEMVEGLRAGGSEEPMIVLGAESEQELSALAFEVGADAYVCVHTTTTRTLVWVVARAVERHRLIRENHRLLHAERQRLHREHDEADRLLGQQRALLRDLEQIRERQARLLPLAAASGEGLPHVTPALGKLPRELVDHYRELLRAYVIMGSGSLAQDIQTLADLLATAELAPLEAMQLHLEVLEELVRGLGSRSSRHVMSRADLLALEVVVHLAEGYRRRYHQHRHPPRQLPLPGFDAPAEACFR
jgi:DNA-binding response OmpR family regulator